MLQILYCCRTALGQVLYFYRYCTFTCTVLLQVLYVISVFCKGKGTISVCKTVNGKHDKDIIVVRGTITECERLGDELSWLGPP